MAEIKNFEQNKNQEDINWYATEKHYVEQSKV